jgi:hypothetical protein
LIGYALGTYTATPVGATLIRTTEPLSEHQITFFYNAKSKQQAYNLVVGGEFNISMFFTGGFLLSFGFDWIMNMLKFKDYFYINNIQTGLWFFPYKKSSYVHSVSFILSAGYAFSN